eukprot:450589-Pelagomonas_calceolata.AAC.4
MRACKAGANLIAEVRLPAQARDADNTLHDTKGTVSSCAKVAVGNLLTPQGYPPDPQPVQGKDKTMYIM